jgi:hypothetical protein
MFWTQWSAGPAEEDGPHKVEMTGDAPEQVEAAKLILSRLPKQPAEEPAF